MDDPTRRGFLITAGVAAAATAGVAAAIAAGHDGPTDDSADTPAALPATAGALVAYVADVRSGRVSLLVGESEVVVNDPGLVATLARHAAGKQV